MKIESTKIDFSGQNVYAGIDVHLKSWNVTIMVNNREHKTYSQDPSAELLWNYLRKNFPGAIYYSAYEAGFCGFSAHRELASFGIRNIVVNPADIPTTDKEKRQKEDKRDSRKIAKSLKNGELTGIYVPGKDMEELRGLIRYRKTLVKEISRHKNRIKSFLYFNGIKIPLELEGPSKHWSGRFTQWLKEVELSTVHGKMVLEDTLDTAETLRKKLLKVNRHLRQINKEGIYAAKLSLLQSIPGIGLITAITLLAEMEDILRFKNLDQLCSFVGLVPSTNSSGEKENVGRITRRSNRFLREVIIESAWMASRLDPSLAYSYGQLCTRMKSNEAIIRIAKKLLNRIRYVMKNETEYVHSVI
ncbi:MAG TPA: IS110 family transposase [Bacteroidales bacterium]|nr:IS110 family transposase [Bacteroidales bacterium]